MVRARLVVAVLALSACSQGSVLTFNTKGDDTGAPVTAPPPDSAGSGTGDVIEQDPVYDDSGGSGSGGGDTDDPEPTYSWASWTGQRTYVIDKRDPLDSDCTGDTVPEQGTRIEIDLEEWEDHCPICSDFYEISYDASSACGRDVDLSAPEVRGFVFRGANLEVWRIREDGSSFDVEIEFNDGPYDAGRATYTFEDSWNGEGTLTVTGFLQFPEETGR